MSCVRCGSRGVFLRLETVDGVTFCEACLHDLGRMGWTVAEWIHAKANHETVQVHEALCRRTVDSARRARI